MSNFFSWQQGFGVNINWVKWNRDVSVKMCTRFRINYLALNSLLCHGFELSFLVSEAAQLSLCYMALQATCTYARWRTQPSAVTERKHQIQKNQLKVTEMSLALAPIFQHILLIPPLTSNAI